MSELEQLVEALWSLFAREIESRDPVFFCFSREALKDHLLAKRIASQSPLKTICDAANACLVIGKNSVTLAPDALSPLACGRSIAIVLVCQQVLAVEEMTRDASRFSETAYFPRLRALMSKDLSPLARNPFSFHEFRRIWNVFEREILACKGATRQTVTFRFDDYTGANQAKQFPLSQALLSRADLIELSRHVRAARLQSGTPSESWNEIRRCRPYLGRRAQKLISMGLLRDEILEQVRRFSHRFSRGEATLETEKTDLGQLDLGVAIDSGDWIEQEYRCFIRRRGETSLLEDPPLLERKWEALLSERTHVFLPFSETENCWMFRESAAPVAAGDTLLILGTAAGIQRARALLDGLSPPVPLSETRIRALAHPTGVLVCPVRLASSGGSEITVRAGRLHQDASSGVARLDYEWLGGICVDVRARRYLPTALPAAIRFGGVQVPNGDLMCVDGALSWGAFERALSRLQTDAEFRFRAPSGRTARLSVAVLPRATERVGFPISDRGLVSPKLQVVTDSEPALVGYREPSLQLRPVSIHELAQLVQAVKEHRSFALSDLERDQLLQRIELSSAPPAVKRLISGAISSRERRGHSFSKMSITSLAPSAEDPMI